MSVEQDSCAADDLSGPRVKSRPVHRGLVFTIVALALLMMSIDTTIVATALHALRTGLHTSIGWAGWTITAYSLGFVVSLPVSGRLSELYGCRKVFLGSIIAFTIASLCCGMVDNIYLLIAMRALQAAGGAGFTPAATKIIVDNFGSARDRAVGLFGSIFSIGAMIGPVFGGLFVTYGSWRGIFLVNVPIGLTVAALAWRYVPADRPRPEGTRQRLDATGIALLGCGLLFGMLAISYLGEAATDAWWPLVAIVLAVAILALWMFFRHINRSANPFIEPRLITGPGFGAVNLLNAVYGGVSSAVIALVPLYAINRYGISALDSSALLVAQGVAAIVLSTVSTFALRRTGYRAPLYAGGAVMAAGTLLLAVSPVAGVTAFVWLTASTFLIGVGRGMNNPASRNAGLQLSPKNASTLAALRTMSMQIGTIATVTIDTAILAGSHDAGHTQAVLFALEAALVLASLPMVAQVPEHSGSW
jgi:MFS family permease